MIKKIPSSSISVLNGSPKMVSSTQDNFSSVKSGSYIQIQDDDFLYPVIKSQSIFYTKPFINNKNRELIINDHCGMFLQKEDSIKIFYKKYTLNSIINIVDGGKKYSYDEIVTVRGGGLAVNNFDGQVYPTRLKVSSVHPDDGRILMLAKTNPEENGDYTVPPEGEIELISNQAGIGAKILANYIETNAQTYITRTIKNILSIDGKTKLMLDYSIDPSVINGTVTAEKWELQLAYNYQGDTRQNANFELFCDFTPHCHLPLSTKNSRSFESLYNQSMIEIDKRLKAIENHLKPLL